MNVIEQLSSRRVKVIAAAVVVCVAVALGFMAFPSAGRDDVYLTAWVAYSLVEYGMPLNYNLELVEQTSSLGFAGFVALGNAVTGASLLTVSKILSVLGSITTGLLVFGMTRRWWAALVSLTPYLLYWQSSGMETTWVAAVFLALVAVWSAAFQSSDRVTKALAVWVAVVTAACLLLRPEFGVVLPVMLVVLLVWEAGMNLSSWRRVISHRGYQYVVGTVGALICTFGVVRLFVFGQWFPNPVGSKVSVFTLERWQDGLSYLAEFNFTASAALPYLVIVTLVSMWRICRTEQDKAGAGFQSVGRLSVLGIAVYAIFILASGGDWMENGRFVAHLSGLWGIVVCRAMSQVSPSSWRRGVIVAVLVSHAAVFFSMGERSRTVPLWETPVSRLSVSGTRPNESWRAILNDQSFWIRRNAANRRDILLVSAASAVIDELRRKIDDPLRVVTGQMGMIAYKLRRKYSSSVVFRDLYGLATKDFDSCYRHFGAGKSRQGLSVDEYRYASREKEMVKLCGFETADILIGLRLPGGLSEATDNYRVVYRQTGRSTCPSEIRSAPSSHFHQTGWCNRESANGYVAVRADLYTQFEADDL